MGTLPNELQAQVTDVLSAGTGVTPAHDEARGLATVDWLVRTWLPPWPALLPDIGQHLAQQLANAPRIVDIPTARSAGSLVSVLQTVSVGMQESVEQNDMDNVFVASAVNAARSAAASVSSKSGAEAAVKAASSVVLEACLEARTDVALDAAFHVAVAEAVDGLSPYLAQWTAGPADYDVKRLSIGNMAPAVAAHILEPIVKPLQHSVVTLFRDLVDLG